jgi:UDP-3-O-[3-hydroxymyristoyl] glucosamine N-acyltransferase
MRDFIHSFSPQELLKGFEGRLILKNELMLNNISELNSANKGSVCFYENSRFLNDLADLNAGLLITGEDFDLNLLPRTNLFLTKKPYLTFNRLLSYWLSLEKDDPQEFIHSSAVLSEDVELGTEVVIRENVVIGRGVKIGDRTIIEANSVISENVTIGKDCHLYPNCTVYANTEIRDRVTVHSSSAIGVDGFGYIFDEGVHHKVNHIGSVLIEDDVEIGANSCIDRGTIGKTIIGRGTKIDNLVQVGHNCQIGTGAILCSQVGLAGNTKIGNYVYLAGQVGCAGHLKVNDGAMIGAQSGISGDVPAGAKYFGTPAIDAGLEKRIVASLKKLPEMVRAFNKSQRKEEDTKS